MYPPTHLQRRGRQPIDQGPLRTTAHLHTLPAMKTSASLVLLPGLMCDRAVWAPVMQHLGEAGQKASVAEYACCDSLTEMARTVLQRHPGALDVAGHSMGGRVALEMMRLAPERLGRVALLATGFAPLAGAAAGQAERQRRQALVDLMQQQGVEAMAREWVKGMVPGSRQDDRELVEAIVEMFKRRSAAEFQAQVRALLDRPDAAPVLRAWPGPVWVIGGELDTWAPEQQQREMAGLLRRGELHLLAGAGHMFPMEAPSRLAPVLREWLHRSNPPKP